MAKKSQLPLAGLEMEQESLQKGDGMRPKKKQSCGPKLTLTKWRVNNITQLVLNGVHLENISSILDFNRSTLFGWLQKGREIREVLECQVGKTLEVEQLVVEAERNKQDSQSIDTLSHIRPVGRKGKYWLCVELHDAVEKAKFAFAERNRPTTLPEGRPVSDIKPVPEITPVKEAKVKKQELTVTKPATFYARLYAAVSLAIVYLEHCPKPDNPIFADTMQRDIQELKDAAAGLEEIKIWMDGKGVLKD